jgi:hypothetical protein
MNDAALSQWLVADGAQVRQGEPLFSIESDKSIEEIPSPASGTLKIIAKPGGDLRRGCGACGNRLTHRLVQIGFPQPLRRFGHHKITFGCPVLEQVNAVKELKAAPSEFCAWPY